jgi:tRNA splicing endonuclease
MKERAAEAMCKQVKFKRLRDEGFIPKKCIKFLFLFVQVQENETSVNEHPSVSGITVELTRPTLSTLLDGMRRIRDQLASVAGRK